MSAPDGRQLGVAKGVLGQLLTQLSVARVVHIDDRFAIAEDLPRVIALAEEAHRHSAEDVTKLLPSVPFELPDRAWRADLEKLWKDFDAKSKRSLLEKLALIAENPPDGADEDVAATPGTYLPRKMEFLELGPAEWEDRRDELLSEASPERRLLCFFDQDLSRAAGYTSEGSKSGIGLLRQISDRGEVLCAILSHHITPDSEVTEWRRFADDVDIPLNAFLPISKARLAEPLQFVSALKKTALNRYAERMKTLSCELFLAAAHHAVEDLSAIDPYEFDHIVLRSSEAEGVSEIETLLRVFNVFHRDHAKRLFLSETSSEEFYALVSSVRPISRIGDSNLPSDGPDHRHPLRQQEMFEAEELVNHLHSPLQNGDLFCRAGEELASYVLLAQPCDTIIRTSGNRSSSGLGVLVPLVREARSPHPSEYRLDNIFVDEPHCALAGFKEGITVKLKVLDLAVLNTDGTCSVDLASPPSPPPQFHVAWKQRRKELLDHYGRVADRLDEYESALSAVEDDEVREKLRVALAPKATLGLMPSGQVDYRNRKFDFGIRRVGRLRSPWADRLLREYMRWQSREAEPHEFAH